MIKINILRCGATIMNEALLIETFPNHEVDLFGDGSIILLPLPGHSEGMTAIKVKQEVSENGFTGSYGAKTFCPFLY